MKTQIIFHKLKGTASMTCLGVAPVHGHMEIKRRRLTFFAPFVRPIRAGNPSLPDSLGEWLASKQVVEIGSPLATPELKPVIRS